MDHPSSNNSGNNSNSGSPDSQHSNGSAGKTHAKPQPEKNSNNHNNSNSSNSNSHSNSNNSNSGTSSNNHVSANNAALLPQLETIERMMKLPVVEAAWHQGQAVYDNVKGYNAVFGWALRTAETAVHTAVNTAAPLVQRLDGPISYVDQTLVTGIEALEAKAPIIKEQPQEIYAQARSRVVDIVQPHVQKVCSLKSAGVQRAASLKTAGVQRAASLKELSWQKANEVLATQYGSMAVDGLDTTSALAERLLDYYFPKGDDADDDAEDEKDATVAAGVDPVLHTCQTVGRLSNKVARRVYRTVSRQVKQLKKEDVHEYVASLIAVLRLTQYLNFINEKVQTNSSIEAASSSSSTSTSESAAAKDAKPANGNSSSNHGSPKPAPETPAAAIAE